MGRLSRTDHRMTRVGVWLLILVVLAGVGIATANPRRGLPQPQTTAAKAPS